MAGGGGSLLSSLIRPPSKGRLAHQRNILAGEERNEGGGGSTHGAWRSHCHPSHASLSPKSHFAIL